MLLQYKQKSDKRLSKDAVENNNLGIRKDKIITKGEELQNVLGNSAVEAIMSEFVSDEFQQGEYDLGVTAPDLKSQYESKYGFNLDDVKIHYNSDKPADFDAYAYTQGSDVYLGPGHNGYLAHELNHVIQQKQGRVSATEYLYGRPVNMDQLLEEEADDAVKQHVNTVGQRSDGEDVIQLKSRNMYNSMHHFLEGMDINNTERVHIDELEKLLLQHDNLSAADKSGKAGDTIINSIADLLKKFNMVQMDRNMLMSVIVAGKTSGNLLTTVENFFSTIDLSVSSPDDLSEFNNLLINYDELGDDDLDQCMETLTRVNNVIMKLNISEAGKEMLFLLVEKERKDITGYWRRTKPNPQPSYDAMVSRGMLWRMPSVAKEYGYPSNGIIPKDPVKMAQIVGARLSTGEFNGLLIRGMDFFRTLSKRNVSDTEYVSNKITKRKIVKYNDLCRRIRTLLIENTRIAHYTKEDKLILISKSEGMISKLSLESLSKTKMAQEQHNTQSVDEIGFANTGFVFAFLEEINAPPSPFHRYGKVRISYRTKDILPMLADGGMMQLFDILQGGKESSRKSANPERETVESKRKETIKPDKKRDKEIEKILCSIPDLADMVKLSKEQRKIFIQVMSTIVPLSYQLDREEFNYVGESGSVHVLSQHLHNNFFVGSDILPGFAARAALELIMLEDAGLSIPDDNRDLIKRILNGMYKIQILLPDRVPLANADIDRA